MSNPAVQSSTKNLWYASVSSIVVATIVFVVFVLPAEYTKDPTGLGKLMGLQGMSGFEVQSLTLEDHAPIGDQVEFPLAPFESIEYKYELGAGEALVYSWVATGEVLYDLHSEEEGSKPEDAISFSVGRGSFEHGTYVAPYAGKHGWYWENRGDAEVVVQLRTEGFGHASITYSTQGEYRRVLNEDH